MTFSKTTLVSLGTLIAGAAVILALAVSGKWSSKSADTVANAPADVRAPESKNAAAATAPTAPAVAPAPPVRQFDLDTVKQAATLRNAARRLYFKDVGGKMRKFGEAVAAYRSALESCSRTEFPQQWLEIQFQLADTLGEQAIAGADRFEDMSQTRLRLYREIIAISRSVQEVFPRAKFPQEWTKAQDYVVSALESQAREYGGMERVRLLVETDAAWHLAQQENPPVSPLVHAGQQFDSGEALHKQALATTGAERARLLGESVAAYRRALAIYTRGSFSSSNEASDLGEVETQCHLAPILRDLAFVSEGAERARLFGEAAVAYRAALAAQHFRGTPTKEWAITQSDLAGVVHEQALASEKAERVRLLGEAATTYRLLVQAPGIQMRYSDIWATVQNELAGILHEQALASTGAERTRLLGEAILCAENALQVFNKEREPAQQQKTQKLLDTLRSELAKTNAKATEKKSPTTSH